MNATSRALVRHRTKAALAIVAIGLLVVLPGYLASRPGFFERYSGLSEQYGPWAESTHAEVGCEGCHVPPTVLARGIYRVRMVGEYYLSVVNSARSPGMFEPPVNDACLQCHNDLRTVSPTGDLQIPHRAHVSVLEMDCIECHNYLVHEESPAGGHKPAMLECLRCHDGDRAKDSCWACHTEKAAPATHSADDWLFVHADGATDDECAECHRWSENWCVQCHAETPRSHGTDWRATHGVRVAEHRGCEACHDGPFCVRCHGVVPQLNYDPTLEMVE